MTTQALIYKEFLLGYDYQKHLYENTKVPIYSPVNHTIVVGGSGSGKSTALLYWLYKIYTASIPLDLTICDFKKSHEFDGITKHFAEFEDCYVQIKQYYEDFLNTPEGGDGIIRILIIDEIAGMLMHLSLTKEGKAIADEIRSIMSSILMMGRSRNRFIWLSMQRFSASIFPSASGSADNFHVIIGLSRMTVDGRKGLFAGEHFDGEDELLFKQGTGIVLIDGRPLQSIIIPRVSKEKMLKRLQVMNEKRASGEGEA